MTIHRQEVVDTAQQQAIAIIFITHIMDIAMSIAVSLLVSLRQAKKATNIIATTDNVTVTTINSGGRYDWEAKKYRKSYCRGFDVLELGYGDFAERKNYAKAQKKTELHAIYGAKAV